MRLTRADAIGPATRRQYLRAFSMFEAWCDETLGHGVLQGGVTAPVLDAWCTEFVGDLYTEFDGHMYHIASQLCHGIFFVMGERYRGHLPELARVCRAWRVRSPGESHQPMPASWVDLVAVTLGSKGNLRLAMGILVAFDSFLRISELLRLTREDVLLADDARALGSREGGMMGGLRLRTTKTGRNQFAPIRADDTHHYLRWLCEVTPPGAPLFPFSPAEFNEALGSACTSLGLPIFTAHSLRHGAASHAALRGIDPEVIRRWGRWKVPHSMDTYLQQVQALLLRCTAPPALEPFLARAPRWRSALFSLCPVR